MLSHAKSHFTMKLNYHTIRDDGSVENAAVPPRFNFL